MNKNYLSFFTRISIILLTAFIYLQMPVSTSTLAAENLDVTIVYLPVIFKNYVAEDTGFGNVSGTVRNARSGLALQGAEVCYTSLCDTTDSLGAYTLLNIPNGERSLTAELFGWGYISKEYVVVDVDTTVYLDFSLIPPLDDDEIRIEVYWSENRTWGGIPNDLNLHLWIEYGNPSEIHHINIDNQGNCQDLDFPPYACYENDEQYGTGPDTIVVLNNGNDFKLGVLNYNAGYPGVPDFYDFSPIVQVFRGSTSIGSYDLEYGGQGDLWYVFQLVDRTPETRDCLIQYDVNGAPPPDDCP